MSYQVEQGESLRIEISALDITTGRPYSSGTVYVLLRNVSDDTIWDSTNAAWSATEPILGDLPTATHEGQGAWSWTVPVAATSGQGGDTLRAVLMTTYTEASEVLMSSVELISVTAVADVTTVAGGTGQRGILASSLKANVLSDLQDDAGTRWGPTVYKHFDDAIRELAEGLLFVREDILVPTAGQASYRTLVDPVLVLEMEYNGRAVTPLDQGTLRQWQGLSWRTETGTPANYLGGEVLRLFPIPGTSGTALAFSGSPTLTETSGLGPLGDGYLSAQNGTDIAHWLEGDGHCTNETAANNLRVRYAYYPAGVTSGMYLPRKLGNALLHHALWKCLENSDDQGEQAAAERHRQHWVEAREALFAKRRAQKDSGEYLPTMQADDTGYYDRGRYSWSVLIG